MERYSLNLSPRYAASWAAWEVAREVICNGLDASPDDMKVTVEGANELRVTTPTVPDLSELFIIGEGTKCEGGKTIGQFGEGIKLAALVATRTEGGSLVLNTPGKTVTFAFDDVYGVPVLHASVDDNPLHESGYEAVIQMPGISMAFAGKLLDDRAEGPKEKTSVSPMRVFCKGVYVSDIRQESIWDWNLPRLNINRDRSMVNSSDVLDKIGTWLALNVTPEIADRLVADSAAVESNYVLLYHRSEKLIAAVVAAFQRKHGEKCCLATNVPSADARAEREGYNVVADVSVGMMEMLERGKIVKAHLVIPKDHDLEPVDIEPHRAAIKKLRQLDLVTGAPLFSVHVFSNRSEARKGFTVYADRRVWLSEGLFTPGNELELVRTYLHETAHVMSDSGDETQEFEHALDGIAGRLGMQLLSGGKVTI